MKKVFKIGVFVIGLLFCFFIVLLIIGPSDPIILSKEEELAQFEQEQKMYLGSSIKDFSTQTVDGNAYSFDSISNNRLTVVDLWTTWCHSCIADLQMLDTLATQLPEGVEMIGICVDTSDKLGDIVKKKAKKAARISMKRELQFPILVPDLVIAKNLTNKSHIFPTILVLNSRGEVVAGPYQGNRSKKAILSYIDSILASEK